VAARVTRTGIAAVTSAAQKITITGSSGAGFTWTCGTCGASAPRTQATRVAALAAYDIHYATSPNTPVDAWSMALMTAGQNLAAAVAVDPVLAAAWTAALQSAPPAVIATWQGGGVTHP
jgi:hypothetical protein